MSRCECCGHCLFCAANPAELPDEKRCSIHQGADL